MVKWIKDSFLVLKFAPMLLNQVSTSMKSSPLLLKCVKGFNDRSNDVICHPFSGGGDATGIVIFFGGDVQDYTDNMMSHRDNKDYVKWNLESTCDLLQNKFPTQHIYVIRAARMHLKTFGCYENFVEGNDFGAPNHSISIKSLQHLKLLLMNAFAAAKENSASASENSKQCTTLKDLPISIIGFSKGCVVLNQLLYSFLALSQQPDKGLTDFLKCIKVMYWLDGAHCGTSDTWVTDKSVLKNYSELPIKTRIHVTPYQVQCDWRPRIAKEERIFRETLRRLGANIQRTLHFEDKSKSLEFHFRILEAFPESD